MPEPIWKIKKYNNAATQELAFELDVPIPVAALCVSRGLDTADKFNAFIDLGYKKLHNPFLLPDIKPVLARLEKALDGNEKIFVWGDYDVDGVTATAVVVTALKLLNANIVYHVPHRMEDGYDIKMASVDKALAEGADLLMTVDCGIVAFEAGTYAKSKGLDLIITDHHHPSDDGRLPEAIGVINPQRHDSKYPFKNLAGVGIAFKLMQALCARRGIEPRVIMDELLEYVALGTVADVAEMADENRSLVALGCQKLTKTTKPGIQQLLKIAGVKEVSTTTIGFQLGPRINAVGRLADSRTALDILLERSDARAKFLAQQLDTANKRRQKQQESTTAEAMSLFESMPDWKDQKIIVVAAKSWHKGLVGLVAGKMAEKYGCPALVMSIVQKEDDDGNPIGEPLATGSCRSTRSFDILQALKSPDAWDCFLRRGDGSVVCGGHAFAAGFTLPPANVDRLRVALNKYASEVMADEERGTRIIEADFTIQPGDINKNTQEAMMRLAPFGSGHEEPILVAKNLTVEETNTMGEGGKHLKLKLKGNGMLQSVQALAWRRGSESSIFAPGAKVDIIFKMSMEEFRGRTALMLTLEDMKLVQPAPDSPIDSD